MTTLTEIANYCEANGRTDPATAHALSSDEWRVLEQDPEFVVTEQ